MADERSGRAGEGPRPSGPRPPRRDADGAPEPSRARPEDLGRARGVRSLRGERAPRDAQGPGAPRWVVAVCALACAAVVFAAAFAGVRALLGAADAARSQAGSAVSATDAYVGVAVTGADGTLAQAGVLYADTINNRALLAWVPADARDAVSGTEEAQTFAEAYARGGAQGLGSALAGSAGVSLAGTLVLTQDELASVRALAAGESGAPSPAGLAAELSGAQGQTLSRDALRGLLATLRDVGDAGFVELSAPTQSAAGDADGASVLRSSEWQALVRGMRDPTA